MIIALSLALCATQDPLAVVQANEARRVAVVARCSPAVCSVMSMDAPGGGSGVVVDPAGFVLTNYHVVGEPDKDWKAPEPPEPTPADLEALVKQRPDAKSDAEAL